MTTPNQLVSDQPTPEERFERAVAGLRQLPPTGAVTFRGVTSPTGTQPGVIVPRGITATSRDLVVATAGMTSPGIAVVVVHTGRDVAPVSAVPQAQEVALLPGTVLYTGRFLQVAGHTVELIEQLMPTNDQQWASQLADDAVAQLMRAVATTISNAQGQTSPVDPAYCARFAVPIA